MVNLHRFLGHKTIVLPWYYSAATMGRSYCLSCLCVKKYNITLVRKGHFTLLAYKAKLY